MTASSLLPSLAAHMAPFGASVMTQHVVLQLERVCVCVFVWVACACKCACVYVCMLLYVRKEHVLARRGGPVADVAIRCRPKHLIAVRIVHVEPCNLRWDSTSRVKTQLERYQLFVQTYR